MQRSWLQSDGDKLKALRESSGMDPVELARSVTLTPAHVRQLEDGGDSMFYSPAIKLSVGRRLLKKLGSDLDPIEEPAPAAAEQPPATVEVATSVARVHEAVAAVESAATVLNPLARWFPAMAASAAIAVVTVVLYQVIKPWPAPKAPVLEVAQPKSQPAVSQAAEASNQTASMTPDAARSATDAMPSAPASNPPAAPAMAVAAEVAKCSAAPVDAVELQPPSSTKPANYVHLVATQETTVCVVDGSSRVTTVHLKPGDARSIYGAAPWRIHSPMLAAVEVYFQGHRMTPAIGGATNVVFTPHALNTLN